MSFSKSYQRRVMAPAPLVIQQQRELEVSPGFVTYHMTTGCSIDYPSDWRLYDDYSNVDLIISHRFAQTDQVSELNRLTLTRMRNLASETLEALQNNFTKTTDLTVAGVDAVRTTNINDAHVRSETVRFIRDQTLFTIEELWVVEDVVVEGEAAAVPPIQDRDAAFEIMNKSLMTFHC